MSNVKREKITFTKSSGNVFKDLGFKDAEARLAKAELASKINELIDKRNLSQTEAAKILQINQPKVSDLMNGRLAGFSMERLIRFLIQLGFDVKITVSEKTSRRKSAGKLEVQCANHQTV